MKQLYFSSLLTLFSMVASSQPISDTSFFHLEERAKFFLHKQPNHDSALKFIEEGISLSIERNDSIPLGFFYYLKGRIYSHLDQNLALEYLVQAKEIFYILKDSSKLAGTYKLIGGLELALTARQRASFLKESVYILEQIKDDTLGLITSYNDLGAFYQEQGLHDSSLSFLNKSLRISNAKKHRNTIEMATLAGIYNNIGLVYEYSGKYAKGLEYFHKALSTIPVKSNEDFLLNIQSNLMGVYLKMGNTDSAFFYFNNIKESLAYRPDVEKNIYIQLSEFYEKENDPVIALSYYKKADSVNKILLARNQINTLNLLELEYDSRIKKEQLATMSAEMAKARNARISLIMGLCLTILFALIIFLQQKQKARKKRALLKAEQKFLNAELQKSEIQKRYLNDELQYTNKELTSFATGMVQNQSLLNDIREQIVSISKEKDTRKIREQLWEMNVMLLQLFQEDKKNEEFLEKSREINHSLIFYLKSHFTQLTESDINLLILMFLNFSGKEISVLYNIEPKSVKMKRYRIRKKLDMEPEASFEEFFSKVVAEMNLKHN